MEGTPQRSMLKIKNLLDDLKRKIKGLNLPRSIMATNDCCKTNHEKYQELKRRWALAQIHSALVIK